MITPHEAAEVLCQEAGLPEASANTMGTFVFEIDGSTLKLVPLRPPHFALIGLLGPADQIAEARREPLPDLLRRAMSFASARLARLGAPEVLSWDGETRELFLWRSALEGSISDWLSSAESMLNEVETWKRFLGAQPA